MSTLKENKSTKESVWKVTRVVLAVLGTLSLVLSLLTIFGLLENVLTYIKFKGTYGDKEQLLVAVSSSIVGILFLFIAFSPHIDRFFSIMERKELKLSRDEKKGGLSLELIFFLTIAIVLIVIALLLGINYLTVQVELPLLGKFTEPFIVGSLVILALVSIVVAFNEVIRNSLKELKKVHWPTGKQMSKYSAQVFSFVIFFGVLFLLFDIVVELGLDGLRNLLG